MVNGRFPATSNPNIKDNFGRVVVFAEVDFNVSVGDSIIHSLYVKDLTRPGLVIIQGLSADLLSLCLGENELGYRSKIISGLFHSRSALIDIDCDINGDRKTNTLEFRMTSDDYLLCFIWNRIVKTNLSYHYFVDVRSPNYMLCDCWNAFNIKVKAD
jgi:hypothetical protein